MILRLLGLILLFIAISSAVVVGAAVIAGFQPELYSGAYMEPVFTVNDEGDIIALYSFNPASWRNPVASTGTYDYRVHFTSPVVPPPPQPTIEYGIRECRLYIVSDPQNAARVTSAAPYLAPYRPGGYIDTSDYNAMKSILEALADYKDRRNPVNTGLMDACSIDVTVGSLPQIVVVEMVLDKDSIRLASHDVSINGTMLAELLKNMTITEGPTVAVASPVHPQGPPAPVVTRVAVITANPTYEWLLREFSMVLSRVSMEVTAIINLNVFDMWRIASIMLAGFMIIVVDAGRSPHQYSRGPWRVFRRIAVLLGISRG